MHLHPTSSFSSHPPRASPTRKTQRPRAPPAPPKHTGSSCHHHVRDPSERSTASRLCIATIDDGTLLAREVVDEHGCVPFWLPPSYVTVAKLTCHDAPMDVQLSERQMRVHASTVPSPCKAIAGFAHGFFLAGDAAWRTACRPIVPCDAAGGTARLLGDSVGMRQGQHWVENFFSSAGSNCSLGLQQGFKHISRGTVKLAAGEATVDGIKSHESSVLGAGVVVCSRPSSQATFVFEPACILESHFVRNASVYARECAERLTGRYSAGAIEAPTARLTAELLGRRPTYNWTLVTIGHHQEWDYATMYDRSLRFHAELRRLGPSTRWVNLLMVPPNTSLIPTTFAKQQRQTRTVLQTWWAARAIIDAAWQTGVGVADIFSPTLVRNELVHEHDAVHVSSNCEALRQSHGVTQTASCADVLNRSAPMTMRLSLLGQMCDAGPRGKLLRYRENRVLVPAALNRSDDP